MTRSDIIYVVNYAVSDEEKKLQRISYTSLKKKKKKRGSQISRHSSHKWFIVVTFVHSSTINNLYEVSFRVLKKYRFEIE